MWLNRYEARDAGRRQIIQGLVEHAEESRFFFSTCRGKPVEDFVPGQ